MAFQASNQTDNFDMGLQTLPMDASALDDNTNLGTWGDFPVMLDIWSEAAFQRFMEQHGPGYNF